MKPDDGKNFAPFYIRSSRPARRPASLAPLLPSRASRRFFFSRAHAPRRLALQIRIPRVSAHISVRHLHLRPSALGGEARARGPLDGLSPRCAQPQAADALLQRDGVRPLALRRARFSTGLSATSVCSAAGLPSDLVIALVSRPSQYVFNPPRRPRRSLRTGLPFVRHVSRITFGLRQYSRGFGRRTSSGDRDGRLYASSLAARHRLRLLTYLTYLKHVDTSAAPGEQAERTSRGVHYIAEQDRIAAFSQLAKMSALGELASGVAHDSTTSLLHPRPRAVAHAHDRPKDQKGCRSSSRRRDGQDVKRIQDFGASAATTTSSRSRSTSSSSTCAR